MRIGVLPLGRPTFDVPYAEEKLAAMLAALEATGHEVGGPRALLMDAEANAAALEALRAAEPDLVLALQVTFTDAAFIAEVAAAVAAPLAIWAPREPRAGGRLRLNAFCGLNLASHALGLRGRRFSYLYADPETAGSGLRDLLSGASRIRPRDAKPAGVAPAPLPEDLRSLRIARIGAHPGGFDTCAYDPAALRDLLGAEVDELELDALFARARALPDGALAEARNAASRLAGLDALDRGEVDRSLRLAGALRALREEHGYDAMAIRCWPEAFTEYGGAVCGPVSILGEGRAPCACEADVYGAVTQAVMQRLADAPVFLVDLVDLDADDDTGVVWHCGQAPASMADPETAMRATVHTNRKMALLYEFPLKPGRVTFFRISQARGAPKIVIATGEMLRRPMAFTGTSGVVRFDRPASDVLGDVMDAGLEHHMALAYGDHAERLRGLAAALDLGVIMLGERDG